MNTTTAERAGRRPALDLGALLAPRSIAVVGASANESGYSSRSLTNLLRTGYTGEIYPVNPRHAELAGQPCYPSVTGIGRPVDAAVLLLGAELVPAAVRDCVEAGVKIITICASGFAEEGAAGKARQRELVDLARAGGSRLVGPNCIGSVDVIANVVACPTLNITGDFTPGGIGIASQSGGMAINLFNRAQGRGIGIRGFASVGNEADVDVADVVDAMADDEHTTVIALFIEQLRDVPAFARAVAKAHRAGKPVLALKAGRSEAGARSSLSHTGAMAGSQAIFRQAMTQLGVLEVDSVDALIDAAHLLCRVEPPASNRLLIVSPSGGECSYAADRAGELGLQVPPLPEQIAEAVGKNLRFGIPANPFDLTGQVVGDPEFLRGVLQALERAQEFDMVLYAIPTWGPHDARRLLPAFVAAAEASGKPTAISAWSASNLTEEAQRILNRSGAVHFGSVDQALSAFSHLARWARLRRDARAFASTPQLGTVPRPDDLPPAPTEHQAKAFLRDNGLAVCREVLVHERKAIPAAAAAVGWPLVAKQLCTGVIHKSDFGLVATGLRDQAELDRALQRFSDAVAHHDLEPEGILLCEAHQGAEVILGGIRDPGFGPMLMIGAGGIMAELVNDAVFRRCPIDRHDAEAAVDELAVGRLLDGYRGKTYDKAALIELIVDFSQVFAACEWLAQADLNPVIVADTPQGGAVVVDAMLIPTPSDQEH